MHRYSVTGIKTQTKHHNPQQPANIFDQNLSYILNKYPDLLTSLTGIKFYDKFATASKFKCEGRILRRDTERLKKIKRFKKQPNLLLQRLKQFESVFFVAMEKDKSTTLFNCPICRDILKDPVTLECGHTACNDCLNYYQPIMCKVCDADIAMEKRCINVLIRDLVEKWREKNKENNNQFDYMVPSAVDIFGLEPRYHLRSGFSGLQLRQLAEPKVLNMLEENLDKIPNYKWMKHKTESKYKSSGIWNRDNFERILHEVFQEVDMIKKEALRKNWSDIIVSSDLECILCSRCFLEPVTTGCGHTFCRDCLTRVLDHDLSCPLCMTPLNIHDYSRSTTFVLEDAIKLLLPEEYDERISSKVKECLTLEDGSDIPVFVCTNAFPGVACPLYVYEPRYRLLTRRCLNSKGKRFAMASKDSISNSFVSFGTILEVKDAIRLKNGRFILTTIGLRRFKVVSKEEQDGYDMAKVNLIKDSVVPNDKLQELILLHQKVYSKAYKWIHSFNRKVLMEVERLIGQMPNVEKNWPSLPDGPSWTWWLMPILPLSSQLQVGFLSSTSLEKRLRAIDKLLDHIEVRMKGLDRNTVACSEDEDCESCSNFTLPFHH